MKHAALIAITLSSFLVACGSTDDSGEPVDTGDPMDPMDPMDPDPADPSDPDVPPAGSDPCNLNSGFDGDELCILPPEPGEGIQIHTGPPSYDDADALEPYLLTEGENVVCYNVRVPEGGFYYLRQQNRMRSGSHHMLISLVEDTGQEEGPIGECDISGIGSAGLTASIGSIPGSQTPARDFPEQLAPEDEGLARYLPEGAMAVFNMHYVNPTGDPVLREAWVNLYRKPESEVTQRLQSVFLVGDLAADHPPMQTTTTQLSFEPPITEPTRVFQLNGHSHAHTESFTAWHVRGDERTMVYQSFDWAEPDVLTYNSVVENPEPDPNGVNDGGISGTFTMEPGDRFEWECVVNNDSTEPLNFANEAYTAEMCMLVGSYVSDTPRLMAGGCSTPGPGQMGSCFGFAGR